MYVITRMKTHYSSKTLRILVVAVMCVILLFLVLRSRQLFFRSPVVREGSSIFLPTLLSAALDLAEQGGEEVRAVHESKSLEVKSKGKTVEGARELVTDADKRSHIKIVSGFRQVWPDLHLISEERDRVSEGGGKQPNLDRPEVKEFKSSSNPEDFLDVRDLTVWIDPLDATQEFTEDLLEYVTVMVCVAYRGDPIIGVVHQPFKKKTYFGWVGKAYSLPVWEDRSEDSRIRIIVSRSHAGNVEKVARNTIGGNAKVLRAGGAGYKTLSLLGGSADLYLHVTKIKKWDICAPHALLLSAPVPGGMTSLHGLPINYDWEGDRANHKGLLATRDRQLHTEMLEKFQGLHSDLDR